jgi:hypothetical protein
MSHKPGAVQAAQEGRLIRAGSRKLKAATQGAAFPLGEVQANCPIFGPEWDSRPSAHEGRETHFATFISPPGDLLPP